MADVKQNAEPGVSYQKQASNSTPWSDIIFGGLAAAGLIATIASAGAAAPAEAAVAPDVISGADVAADVGEGAAAADTATTAADVGAAATNPAVSVDAGTTLPNVAAPAKSATSAVKPALSAINTVHNIDQQFQNRAQQQVSAVQNIAPTTTSSTIQPLQTPNLMGGTHFQTIFGQQTAMPVANPATLVPAPINSTPILTPPPMVT